MLCHTWTCSAQQRPVLTFVLSCSQGNNVKSGSSEEEHSTFCTFFSLKLLTVPEQVDSKSELLEGRAKGGVLVPALLHDLVYLREKEGREKLAQSESPQKYHSRMDLQKGFMNLNTCLMIVYATYSI